MHGRIGQPQLPGMPNSDHIGEAASAAQLVRSACQRPHVGLRPDPHPASLILTCSLSHPLADPSCLETQTVGVRKDDDESAMEKLSAEHEENNADPEEIPDPEEIGEEIEVREKQWLKVSKFLNENA